MATVDELLTFVDLLHKLCAVERMVLVKEQNELFN